MRTPGKNGRKASMSNSKLPERASLEYLKKRAKDRLAELRQSDPAAKLATALLIVARDLGFSSWRALKTEVEQRQGKIITAFLEACAKGDVESLRGFLANDPSLARVSDPQASYQGWTGLHSAAKQGHIDAVRLLLDRGADPNAREAGDNTYPLHWAAAHRHIEIVRAPLDAGGDPHGLGASPRRGSGRAWLTGAGRSRRARRCAPSRSALAPSTGARRSGSVKSADTRTAAS